VDEIATATASPGSRVSTGAGAGDSVVRLASPRRGPEAAKSERRRARRTGLRASVDDRPPLARSFGLTSDVFDVICDEM
jgi:hypothetical protein